jgi:diaminobutyrate-2-oxoglutarate transaminase
MSTLANSFEQMHFSPAPQIDSEIPGPRSRELLDEQARLESNARSYPRAVPIAMAQGRGATIRDADGNTFLDFFGGAGVVNVGHSNQEVLAAAAEQQQELVHALDFPTETKLRLLGKLKAIMPGRLRQRARFHFGGPTGSDAVEAALKLVRAHTKRQGLIAFHGSYHGMTEGALSVTSDTGCGGPSSAPVHFLPYPYCYRCPLGLERDSCQLACARLLETTLDDPHSGVPKPAGVIIEPVQGEGGTIVPPPGYLAEVRRITSEHEVPLIFDEIQSGFGRTGTMFACEHDQVTPEVMTLSKALGGVGYPLSCVAYEEDLDSWKPGAHIGTFRGHQVAMAAGDATIDFIAKTGLVEHAARLGQDILQTLTQEQHRCPAIGEVRGRGLMIGIELVADRHTRQPSADLAQRVRRECARRGLIVEVGGHFSNVLRFLPPLVITEELLARGTGIFIAALGDCEADPHLGAPDDGQISRSPVPSVATRSRSLSRRRQARRHPRAGARRNPSAPSLPHTYRRG